MMFPVCRTIKGCSKEPLVTQLVIENQLTHKRNGDYEPAESPSQGVIDHNPLLVMMGPSGCYFVEVKPVPNGGALRSDNSAERGALEGAGDVRV